MIQIGIAAYGLLVIGYLLLRVAVGERWNVVALANNFVPWMALGGGILSVVALGSPYRWLLVGLQIPGLVAFLVLYGALLVPQRPQSPAMTGRKLVVATYNILG